MSPLSTGSPLAERGPSKPAVVEAITRLNIGGPARHVLSVATGLEHRYSIRVATGTAPRAEGELHAPTHIDLDRLPMVRSVSPHRDVAALAGMRRLFRRHRTDLVHSHMAKAGSVARVAAASTHPRPSTIHTFHGHVLAGYFSARTEALFAGIERQLAKRTDRLVAVSEEVRDALLDLGIGRADQYEVVPLGLDLGPYLSIDGPNGQLRRFIGVPASEPLVGVVARLAPVKDHATLLEALVGLPDVHLAIIGDGELRGNLTATVAAMGLAHRVHFVGWWQDMPAALADVDAVALSSRNEGTPMALIEASAASRPMVATDVGGMSRVVVDGRTGLLVPPGDAEGLAGALRRVLDHRAFADGLGAQGRRHVQRHFGMQASLDQLCDLYDDVLARRGPQK